MQKISQNTATALVVANMIGTGVFTSLGFQLVDIKNTWSIILLWVLGALMALSGAYSYAELSSRYTQSGGEYHFLSEIYHPLLGYLSGWVSLTVGFAAPIALAAITLASYLQKYSSIDSELVAVLVVAIITSFHLFNLKKSSVFQNYTTLFKILVILIFIVIGLFHSHFENAFDFSNTVVKEIALPSFAVSLIYVSYAFSGWNAVSYIIEEVDKPKKNVAKALLNGTLTVSIIYILLQLVFLKNATVNDLIGKPEIAQIVSTNMLGDFGGFIFSFLIAIMLVSSISAMVWVGPRVTKKMSEKYAIWRWLSKENKNKIPIYAIIFQSAISIILIITGTFEQILIYTGFLLTIFSLLSVLGLFFIKRQNSKTFKSPLFPYLQLFFILYSLWIIGYSVTQQTKEVLIGTGLLSVGLSTYFINQILNKTK